MPLGKVPLSRLYFYYIFIITELLHIQKYYAKYSKKSKQKAKQKIVQCGICTIGVCSCIISTNTTVHIKRMKSLQTKS